MTPAAAAPNPPEDPGLIACPHCDALYTVAVPEAGARAVCERCHTVLIAPRINAVARIVGFAVTVLILVVSATFLPFLEIHVSGLSHESSVMDAALAFATGPTTVLAVAVAAMIVMIPALRVLLLLYVLVPMLRGQPPLPGARSAFGLSEAMRPWAMAEIFVIGCAVALVKVADLATIGFGPAFWMFAVLVVILLFQDNYMCRWTIWKALQDQRTA